MPVWFCPSCGPTCSHPTVRGCFVSSGEHVREGVGSVQIKISTRHGHLSEATQEKLRTKLEKLTRHFERLTEVELTVDLAHKDQPAVELRVNAEHKHDFVATAEAKDGELMAAADSVLDKLDQQIRKYKEKVQEHRGPGLSRRSAEAEAEAEPGE
jgi:putative sigma-54 modulation protein